MWSLGCVLHEMCLGCLAFPGNNPAQIIMKIMTGLTDDLSDIRCADLRELLQSLLAHDSLLRPSAGELLQHEVVRPHVEHYLKELEKSGPQGWSSWRTCLPGSPGQDALAELLSQVFCAEEGGSMCLSGLGEALPPLTELPTLHEVPTLQQPSSSAASRISSNGSSASSASVGSILGAGYEELRLLQAQVGVISAVPELEACTSPEVSASSPVAPPGPLPTRKHSKLRFSSTLAGASQALKLPPEKPKNAHLARALLQGMVPKESSSKHEKRVVALRERCLAGLGQAKFDRLHAFLQARSALFCEDDGMVLRIELLEFLDEKQMEFWPLMEELIFYENMMRTKDIKMAVLGRP
ncbi:hypothetical protein CYMTET_15322 [Cymbomonas tetramitiformis]|uniref:non-specific serine/threonine protein kinase n=1 Tax=Cymbomonas tetramitiformis TaxID=36881 RepID=A0AAE0GEL5_9CHLO|nr:hypothetical protein CYMTET_15322 [Cymbomonas tetramitiformis]